MTQPSPIFCTVCFANYLPQAAVLAESLGRCGNELIVLVLDVVPASASERLPGNVSIETPGSFIDESTLRSWRAIYDITEQATAVKPSFFQMLMEREGKPVVYLDPDMVVFADPWPRISPYLDRAPVALTPHVLSSDQPPGVLSLVLANGVFNLGFLAVSKGSESFLAWWRDRLRFDCLLDTTRNLAVDQRWVDVAPSLFPFVLVDDPGINVGPWNTHERAIGNVIAGLPLAEQHPRFAMATGSGMLAVAHFSKATLRPLGDRTAKSDDLVALDRSYGVAVGDQQRRFGALPKPVFDPKVARRRAKRRAEMTNASNAPRRRKAAIESRIEESRILIVELARRYRHSTLVRTAKRLRR